MRLYVIEKNAAALVESAGSKLKCNRKQPKANTQQSTHREAALTCGDRT